MARLRQAMVAAVIALGSVPAVAQVMPTPDYLRTAGASDLFEQQASDVVLDSTKRPAIRRFAQMMIADHSQSSRMVMDAAAQAGFHPAPPSLSPKQLRMLADLKEAKGTRRDEIYVEQQKAVHDAALKLQQDYALTGGVPSIKAAAARIAPVVQQHIAMLKDLPAM